MRPTPLHLAHDASHYGGKASKLAHSLTAGLPVPPGFALGTTHVEAVAGNHQEALHHLRAEFEKLGGPCAVRSSAIGEDSDSASFAGQHLTRLNVRHVDQLVPAVLNVRESAHGAAAKAYRAKLGLDPTPKVGVVVQRMIDPTCAGVMFTQDPLTGAPHTVIEAAWGLGEAVVAGLVVPDHFVLDAHGAVIKRKVGTKDLALHSDLAGGTIERPVAADLIESPCLTAGHLTQLHELARRCEAHFGRGLDLEWAVMDDQVFLLQCRAMTRNR